MIGAWQRFMQGQPPQDGSMIVVLERSFDDIETIFAGGKVEATVGVFRHGYLHDQLGGYRPVQPGAWWTQLPPAHARL